MNRDMNSILKFNIAQEKPKITYKHTSPKGMFINYVVLIEVFQ